MEKKFSQTILDDERRKKRNYGILRRSKKWAFS